MSSFGNISASKSTFQIQLFGARIIPAMGFAVSPKRENRLNRIQS
jgi:hypothetical protein